MSKHPCPIAGCTCTIPSHLLMCRVHWRMVPTNLQKEVHSTWSNGNPANLQNYLTAKAEAINAVNQQLSADCLPTHPAITQMVETLNQLKTHLSRVDLSKLKEPFIK